MEPIFKSVNQDLSIGKLTNTHLHLISVITALLSYFDHILSETSSLIMFLLCLSVSLEMAVVLSHLIGSPDYTVDFDASFAIGVCGVRLEAA